MWSLSGVKAAYLSGTYFMQMSVKSMYFGFYKIIVNDTITATVDTRSIFIPTSSPQPSYQTSWIINHSAVRMGWKQSRSSTVHQRHNYSHHLACSLCIHIVTDSLFLHQSAYVLQTSGWYHRARATNHQRSVIFCCRRYSHAYVSAEHIHETKEIFLSKTLLRNCASKRDFPLSLQPVRLIIQSRRITRTWNQCAWIWGNNKSGVLLSTVVLSSYYHWLWAFHDGLSRQDMYALH